VPGLQTALKKAASSARQAQSPQQRSTFRPKPVELGVSEAGQPHHPLGQCLLELIECSKTISYTEAGSREIKGRGVLVAAAFVQDGDMPVGALAITRRTSRVTQLGHPHRGVTSQLRCLLQRYNRLLVAPGEQIRASKRPIRQLVNRSGTLRRLNK
jgi:hypothetical protein